MVKFTLTFLGIFLLTYGFLWVVGATPDPVKTAVSNGTDTPTIGSSNVNNPELPTRIVAKNINLDATVVNPTVTDVEVLDQALTEGAVRYPTSAQLGQEGTVVLFGHSSYLPVVYHQYYKTFDGIQSLKAGEVVSVYSGTHEYRYQVKGVRVADATSDVVELPTTGKHLTLITCNSFAAKTNRFVVEADFVGAFAITRN